jgi:hypothetical protein
MNPNAQSGTSSAGGLFQFVDGTANQYHLRNKFDAEANADAGARLTADNITGLRRDLGRDPSPGEVYLAHFSGYGVAEKLAKAPADTPVSAIFSPQAIAANRSILAGKTAGEVKDWADAKMATAMHQAGAGENPDWYKALSPEQRYVIDNEVDTRNNQIAAENRANIEVATTNGPAAMLSTGQYTGTTPTQQQFFDAYGPQEGASRYDAFVSSMQTSKQAYDMRTMSAADIQQMVNAAKPTSSGDDAALQAARYKTLQDAQEATIKAREADPATYTRQAFPDVNEKWNNAQNIGNYQEAMAASIKAQQQIGIVNVKPIPKPVVDTAVKAFKDETQPQANRIGAVASIVMATNDPAQRQAAFNQMVEQGLPDITQGAFEALSRGDSGAAERLFQAAMVDPTNLAGKIPNDIKTSDIDQAVQAQIMDQGQIGDIYYGLSSGTAENYTRAQRDSKLINNAVNLRLRNGETMDQAIAGVSKDLYGDVQVVDQGHMQILVPTNQDRGAVITELSSKLPEVETALKSAATAPTEWPSTKQMPALKLTPQEQHLYQHHLDNLNNHTFVRNDDGSVSTLYQTSVDIKGRTYNFPTVWDGKLLSPHDAVERSIKEGGLNSWPSYPTVDAAESRYQDMHKVLEQDVSALDQKASGGNAVINAAMANHIPNILANGFFRNSGDGYVFIDPYTDKAVSDESGAPIIFKITGNLPPAQKGPITDLGTTGPDAQQINQMRRTMGQ